MSQPPKFQLGALQISETVEVVQVVQPPVTLSIPPSTVTQMPTITMQMPTLTMQMPTTTTSVQPPKPISTPTYTPTTYTPTYTPPVQATSTPPAQKTCTMCGKRLSSFGVNLHNGQPYCSKCFDELSTPTCKKCAQPLKDYWCEVEGNQYHEDCYKCVKCGLLLSGKGHFIEYGEFYCGGCA